MRKARAKPGGKKVTATRDDLLHLFGEIDERKLLDILACAPLLPRSKRLHCGPRVTAMF